MDFPVNFLYNKWIFRDIKAFNKYIWNKISRVYYFYSYVIIKRNNNLRSNVYNRWEVLCLFICFYLFFLNCCVHSFNIRVATGHRHMHEIGQYVWEKSGYTNALFIDAFVLEEYLVCCCSVSQILFIYIMYGI